MTKIHAHYPMTELLDLAIARFKTPGLRDLGHSNPYMHNGQFDTLENAVGFYLGSSTRGTGGNASEWRLGVARYHPASGRHRTACRRSLSR